MVRWIHLHVQVGGSGNAAEVIARMGDAIERAVAEATSSRLLACRIELTGRTELHDLIVSSREHLTAEARAAALALGDEAAWIERLVISTAPFAANAEVVGDNQVDSFRSMIGQAVNDPGFRAQLEMELGDLLRKLPHDIRADADRGLLKAAADGSFQEVIDEAGRYLAARLSTEGV